MTKRVDLFDEYYLKRIWLLLLMVVVVESFFWS